MSSLVCSESHEKVEVLFPSSGNGFESKNQKGGRNPSREAPSFSEGQIGPCSLPARRPAQKPVQFSRVLTQHFLRMLASLPLASSGPIPQALLTHLPSADVWSTPQNGGSPSHSLVVHVGIVGARVTVAWVPGHHPRHWEGHAGRVCPSFLLCQPLSPSNSPAVVSRGSVSDLHA